MDTKDVILSLKDVSVRYSSKPILDSINLEVNESEIIVIIGLSGGGKTTLLNAIAGFVPFDGSIIKPSKIGIVFQNYAVFPWMTVKDNISFGISKGKKLNHYLKMIELQDKKDSYPFELSGGQIQRVALARTLAADPDLILMDEPYGALDIYTREKMQKWLLDIWKEERKTIVFVTHSIEEAIFLADRVIILKDKTFFEEFTIDFKRPRSEDIKFESKFIELKSKMKEVLNNSEEK